MSMTNFYGRRQILVCAGQAGALENIQYNFALQSVGQVCTFIRKGATPVLVSRDGRKVPIGIVERSDDLCGIRN